MENIICIPTRGQPQCSRHVLVIKRKYGSQNFNLWHTLLKQKVLDKPCDFDRRENKEVCLTAGLKRQTQIHTIYILHIVLSPGALQCRGSLRYLDSRAERKTHLTCTLQECLCRLKIFLLLLFFLKKNLWDLLNGPLKLPNMQLNVCLCWTFST